MAEVIRAFSAVHVCRVTGLSQRQLNYWDDTKFFSPYHASENRRSPFSRVYSFDDVVGLRTIAILRKDHKVPLQELRKVAEYLGKYHSKPWSGLVLYVAGKQVHFREPATGKIRKAGGPQYVIAVTLRKIVDDVRARAETLRCRRPDQIGQVERNRNVVHNAWVLAGTRIPTKAIWRYHKAGYATDHIIREYPQLTKADVASAISHEERLAI
ncbi:MAG TPA: DUF433 domain-containing protein [Candidatus Binataceae bacterium]|nr:DUF433 domain-containing protein [Candidatus Binataceae bacterium]